MPPGVWVCVWCTCVCHTSTAPHRQHHRLVSVLPATSSPSYSHRTRIAYAHITEKKVSCRKKHVLLLIGTELNVLTACASVHYTRAHDIVYWICIDFSSIFDFLPSWTHLGEGNKAHGTASRKQKQNTPGGTEIQEDKERHTRTWQQCQYVCGAKIALYNVWFSALADVERGFCNFCQNPLTSPFFDFSDNQKIKSSISNLSRFSYVPIWHNLKLT